tara:strand:- start:326 stop:589 length:264 start_codon:yes stop_codon:yes gene_type:complete
MEDINTDKIKKLIEKVKSAEHKTDFVISWFAKKYGTTIFRAGNMNQVGCRTWTHATNGDKYICFFDPIRERYTTAINPMITYKRKVS